MKDNKKLKELSDNYELDFDPAAWDKMEELLPEAASPRVPFFKRWKVLAAIAVLLLAFVGGLFNLSKNNATQTIIVKNEVEQSAENQSITKEEGIITAEKITSTEAQKSTTQDNKTELTTKTQKPTTRPQKLLTLNPKIKIQNPQPENPFFQKVKQTLNDWQTQTSPEKTYLHVDRPLYKPGESIWFAAYLRNAGDLRPSQKSDIVYVEWIAPSGKIEKTLNLIATNGVVAGDILTTKEMVGGTYKLKVYTNWQRNTDSYFEKEIQVQKTVLPRLRMDLDFAKEAYGKGDEVTAILDLKNLENSTLNSYDFSYVVSVNGVQILQEKTKTNELGHADVSFKLPEDLESNDGLLNILIGYNGQTESISRAIPIVLNKIDLQFFPEGGQNLANIKRETAFKAVNEFGEPTDIEGLIRNEIGEIVTTFKSYHQGMGAFSVSLNADEIYTAEITKPTNISQKYSLPKAEKSGYALSIKEVTKTEIIAEVSTTENEELHLVAQARDQAFFHYNTAQKVGTQTVRIPTQDLPIGITQLTLFDSQEIPRAERLVFVNSDRKLDIKITTDKEQYQPREKVKMTVEVRDEYGKPTAGTFSLAVADDNLLTYTDDKQAHILAEMLLQSDVKGKIYEPNYYFDTPKVGDTKDQKLALDYLLMTQGWRRFAWENANTLPIAEMDYEAESTANGFTNVEYKRVVEKREKSAKSIIRGKVFDASNGEPLIGVSIAIAGTSKGTVTDFDGQFSLEVPQGKVELNFGYIGYTERLVRFKVNTQETISTEIELKEESGNLAEIVIAATRIKSKQNQAALSIVVQEKNKGRKTVKKEKKKKKRFDNNATEDEIIANIESGNVSQPLRSQEIIDLPTRNITSIKAEAVGIGNLDAEPEEVKKRSFNTLYYVDGILVPGATLPKTSNENVQEMLSGKLAGIDITEDEKDILIRGEQQKGKAPLYVVDGVEMPNLSTKSDLLDTDNIAKIEVLNQASGVAIYGEAAEDGAVIITTEKNAQLSQSEKRIVLKRRIYSFENFIEELQERAARGESLAAVNSSFETQYREVSNLRGQYQGEDALALQTEISRLGNAGRDLFSEQEYARDFKSGLYRARQFYTPKYRADREVEKRTDFRSTIYWNPTLTVENDGKAEVEFYNSDEITTFKAIIEGFADNGAIGRAEKTFYSILPFGMTTKVPNNVLVGDEVILPLTLMNNTAETLTGFLTVTAPQGFISIEKIPTVVTLSANEKTTLSLPFKVENFAKNGTFKVLFESDNLNDEFEQNITVLQRGFPVNEVVSGKGRRNKFNINVSNLIDKSLSAKLVVYPNLEENIIETTEQMLRQPTGCFEQTSSFNYPNLLVLDFLESTGRLRPQIQKKAQQYLAQGYERLLSFEVDSGGFDWFGKPPGHEALTAYGLMQFVDMKSVYQVDNQMIKRTADWLLSRRDGKGGWQNAKNARHSWATQTPVGNAYIVWAMTEAGYGNELTLEIEKSYENALKTQDSYLMALVVLALQNVEDQRAEKLLELLSAKEQKDGTWTGLTHSMTHSKGKNLTIETTALTALAMLRTDQYQDEIERAINYLFSAKTAHGFGSTQSTVLAMKALVENAKKSPIIEEQKGEVTLLIDGEKVKKQSYFDGSTSAIIFDDLAGYFTEGNHLVEVKFNTEAVLLPFDFSVEYATTLPPSSPKCAVSLTTKIQAEEVATGETVRYIADIQNVTNEDVANPIAVIGIPAGLSLQPWQLKKLTERKLCDYYELKGNYLVLYFRGLTAGEQRTINLDLKADFAGQYKAAASVAYLYYENEYRSWSEAASITTVPRR